MAASVPHSALEKQTPLPGKELFKGCLGRNGPSRHLKARLREGTLASKISNCNENLREQDPWFDMSQSVSNQLAHETFAAPGRNHVDGLELKGARRAANLDRAERA